MHQTCTHTSSTGLVNAHRSLQKKLGTSSHDALSSMQVERPELMLIQRAEYEISPGIAQGLDLDPECQHTDMLPFGENASFRIASAA